MRRNVKTRNERMRREDCAFNRDGACVAPGRQREVATPSGAVMRLSWPCRFCCRDWRDRHADQV